MRVNRTLAACSAATLAVAVLVAGCSSAAPESGEPVSSTSPPAGEATANVADDESAGTDASDSESPVPEVSATETTVEPAKVRPTGWVGPEDGITTASLGTHTEAEAKAAANAALDFLRRWTLREDLMRGTLAEAHSALTDVTPELSSNAAAAWQQNLDSTADGKENADAWGNLTALVLFDVGSTFQLPDDEPVFSNRTFVGDVFVTADESTMGLRVNVEHSGVLTRLAKPAKPAAGKLRSTVTSTLSLVMTPSDSGGWEIFSWQGDYDVSDAVQVG